LRHVQRTALWWQRRCHRIFRIFDALSTQHQAFGGQPGFPSGDGGAPFQLVRVMQTKDRETRRRGAWMVFAIIGFVGGVVTVIVLVRLWDRL